MIMGENHIWLYVRGGPLPCFLLINYFITLYLIGVTSLNVNNLLRGKKHDYFELNEGI